MGISNDNHTISGVLIVDLSCYAVSITTYVTNELMREKDPLEWIPDAWVYGESLPLVINRMRKTRLQGIMFGFKLCGSRNIG